MIKEEEVNENGIVFENCIDFVLSSLKERRKKMNSEEKAEKRGLKVERKIELAIEGKKTENWSRKERWIKLWIEESKRKRRWIKNRRRNGIKGENNKRKEVLEEKCQEPKEEEQEIEKRIIEKEEFIDIFYFYAAGKEKDKENYRLEDMREE